MSVFLLYVVPAALAVLGGIIEGRMTARLADPYLRRAFLPLLPGGSGLAALGMAIRALTETGWAVMEWAVYAFYFGSAFLGSLLGWGLNRRKEPV